MSTHPEHEGGAVLDDPESGRWAPHVSMILPVRNEANHIEACLGRLLEQDYPRHLSEILVVDGCSDDDTADVVRRIQERHPEVSLRLLRNPLHTVPPALNLGIRAATGDVVIRVDGHTVPHVDYVSRCVAALAESGAANVGGVIEPRGATSFGRAVALATQHPLGAGDARYRIGGAAGDVDTVPFGAFRRDIFERVGLFDESMVRNQDYEFNVRIRDAGERIYLDPMIRATYSPRDTVKDLWSQYFQYGWWRVETWKRHPDSLRWRQAVPAIAASFFVLLTLIAPWSPIATALLGVATAVYLAAVSLISWRIARLSASVGRVVLAFVTIHFAYGFGFLANVISGGRFPFRAQPAHVPRLGDRVDHSISEVSR